MTLSNEEILKAIAKKPVMEIVELIAMMEKEFNVTAAVAVAAPAGGGAVASAAAEDIKKQLVEAGAEVDIK